MIILKCMLCKSAYFKTCFISDGYLPILRVQLFCHRSCLPTLLATFHWELSVEIVFKDISIIGMKASKFGLPTHYLSSIPSQLPVTNNNNYSLLTAKTIARHCVRSCKSIYSFSHTGVLSNRFFPTFTLNQGLERLIWLNLHNRWAKVPKPSQVD